MSSLIVVWLVSKPKMAELQMEPEGLTWAQPEIGAHAPPYPEGIVRCRIGASELVDSDKRYAERAQWCIEKVLAVTPERAAEHPTLSHALEFYRPLLPGRDALNDTGHKESLGAILSPERCKGLLQHWQSVNADGFRQAVDEYIRTWEPVRPPVHFRDGAHVLEYMSCYGQALQEAVASDSFYVSFYLW